MLGGIDLKKHNQVWTAVTPHLHNKLKEYATDNNLAATRAKMVMYILYNYRPKELLEDYNFRSEDGKTISIKVSDDELKYIENLAGEYGVTISRLLRSMVYTYFLEKDVIKTV